MTPPTSEEVAKRARVTALHAAHTGQTSHIGSALSVIDILSVIYSGAAKISPDTVDDPDRDVVIVSKGHAAAGVYAVLAQTGFFPTSWLDDYCLDGARLGGHVTSHHVPGVELSTGSLGHGLPYGLGVALAARRLKRPTHVFVVMSDGECDEGTTWESALIAAHHELDNLTVVIDRNRIQSLADTESTVRLEPFGEKWAAFGWNVLEVDGHDHQMLRSALGATVENKPTVLICETVKGKGVSFMEGTVLWHYRSPNDELLAAALAEVEGR
jgi:transketolase